MRDGRGITGRADRVKKRKPRKAGRAKVKQRLEALRNHAKTNDPLADLVDGAVTQAVEKALGQAVDTAVDIVVNFIPDGV